MKSTHAAFTCLTLLFVASPTSADPVRLDPADLKDAVEYQWGNVNTWKTSAGASVTVVPTNGEDIVLSIPSVTFSSLGLSTGVTVGYDRSAKVADGAVDPTVGTITGEPRVSVFHAEATTSACQPIRRFTIGQAADFLGFWYARNAKAYFTFNAVGQDDIGMSSLSAANRPHVDVTSANTTVTLSEAFGTGSLEKDGAGTLNIESVSADAASNINYVVRGGTLNLPGSNEEDLEDLFKFSRVHLDASKIDTLVCSNGSGRVWVTKWQDVHGRSVAAEHYPYGKVYDPQYFVLYTIPGYVAEETSPTGLRLVSFGSRGGEGDNTALYGPTNAVLRLKEDGKLIDINVKEAFYVVRTPQGANKCTILGDSSCYCFYSDYRLFEEADVYGYGIRNGEMRLDGEPITHDKYNSPEKCATLSNRTYVMNVAPTNDNAYVNLLGSDRYFSARSGGSRVGEVLLFTNRLTRAQRVRINNYLVNKWVKGVPGTDAVGNALIAGTAVKVGVSAGRTARIGDVKAEGAALAKTGSGNLLVQTLQPADTEVSLSDGSFGFYDLEKPTTTAPAADPWLWLDAEHDTSVKTFASAFWPGKDLVNIWRDCRTDVASYAFCPVTNAPDIAEHSMRTPTYTTFAGKRVLDFGTDWPGTRDLTGGGVTNSAFLRFGGKLADGTAIAGDTRAAYAGFIVVRFLSTKMSWQLFSGTGMDFYRDSESTLLNTSYEAWLLSGATWTIDGEIVDPLSTTSAKWLTDTSDFHVIGFVSDRPVNFAQILQDRSETKSWSVSNCGGAQVGEVLSYHRRLTSSERRQTEAYLMEKWLGEAKRHPASEQRVAKMSFVDSAPMAFATEAPMSIGTVVATGTQLSKSGSGKIAIEHLVITNDLQNVTVTDGELQISAFRPDWSNDALFHFDAADLSAYETLVTVDGNGVVVTNILSMQDVRRNGIYATSSYHHNGDAMYKQAWANPTLQYVTMPDGKCRPAIDFGDSQNLADTSSTNLSASGFMLSQNFTDVREVHAIWQDRQDKGRVRMAVATDSSKYNFLRQGDKIVDTFAKEKHPNGPWRLYEDAAYIATNGTQCAYNASLNNNQFYLVSLVPGEGGSCINTIAHERNCTAGGARVCEYVAFGRTLTDDERASVQTYLTSKWFRGEAAGLTSTIRLGRVTLGTGTTLTFDDSAAQRFEVTALSGSGTIRTSGTVAFTGNLDVSFTGPSTCEKVVVAGALNLAAGSKIRVTCSFAPAKTLVPGDYEVVSATTLTGDLPELETVGFARNGYFFLTRRGNALYLCFRKRGSVILFR